MTPQQGTKLHSPLLDYETSGKMLKTTVYRKHTRHTVIKAFSKNRSQTSDEYRADHISQNAVLLMEDRAHLTVGFETQERLLLLFTDSLIIAKTKSLYLKLKARVRLSDIWISSCIHHVTSRKFSAKNSFVIGWQTTNYVVTLSSSDTKEKWFHALQWHSGRARQSFTDNKLGLNVKLFDNTAMTVLTVDVNSTANDVIQSLIQNNSLPGAVSNYQLSVEQDGEEEAYPLIGHELPFCILHHTLNSNQTHTSSLQQPSEGLTTDQTQEQPKSPQFILKSKTASATLKHTGSTLKQKRKKSLIGWALRRGYSSQSEEKSHPDPDSNRLFGLSLASVCRDGILPKAIMDLLCVLYHEGPKTLGIFRRSANAKSCRILKERLNSGHYVSLRGESVFTVASLLTEFLRKLPGSVLGSDLYEDWMDVMEISNLQDRCNSAKSVCVKLPDENRSLLHLLFGALHRIHTNSDVNQMTASNLALCISPNMLWRSSTCSPEQENQNNLEVAALIQFLIENSPSIFGDEVESVFDALSSSAQQTDELTDVSFLFHSSSEDTDQDGLFSPLISQDLDSFLPLTTLHREIHPLKISLAAAEGAYSCGTLNLTSSQSSASVSSLGNAELSHTRSRCLSEPSMCLASPGTPVPPHIPVIRQSSCDNTVISHKIIQSQLTTGFSPLLPSRKGGTGKGRYAFWKSPQFSTRFRHPAQRLTSMSSLSSTTTTSSLSSLDSAVSFSSTEPSPSEHQSRPFVFGASARPQPLTPEMPRKLWKMAFTYEELEAELKERQRAKGDRDTKTFQCGCDVSFKDENGGEEDDGSQSGVIVENESGRIKREETLLEGEDSKNSDSEGKQGQQECTPAPECVSATEAHLEPEHLCHPFCVEGTSQENRHQLTLDNEKRDLKLTHTVHKLPHIHLYTQHVPTPTPSCSQSHRGTSVAHIRLERQLSNSDAHAVQTSVDTHTVAHFPSGQDSVSRMKITFFPTVGRVMLKQSQIKGPGDAREAQVNIPQTLFYKQNAPLMLHSTSHTVMAASNEDVTSCPSKASDDNAPCTQDFSHNQDKCDRTINKSDISHVVSINASASTAHTVSISRVSNGSDSDSVSTGHATQPDSSTKGPSKSAAAFRHTIRIRLPSNVRNTVKAYFSQGHTIPHANTPSTAPVHTPPKSQTRQVLSSKPQKAGTDIHAQSEAGAVTSHSVTDESFA